MIFTTHFFLHNLHDVAHTSLPHVYLPCDCPGPTAPCDGPRYVPTPIPPMTFCTFLTNWTSFGACLKGECASVPGLHGPVGVVHGYSGAVLHMPCQQGCCRGCYHCSACCQVRHVQIDHRHPPVFLHHAVCAGAPPALPANCTWGDSTNNFCNSTIGAGQVCFGTCGG